MTPEPATGLQSGEAGADSVWKRNLAALWLGQFSGVFGFSFVFPFLPLFINRELGVHDHRLLALYSGLATGATGLALVVASPIWGRLADRYGRKPMVVRAMLGGSLTVLVIGVVQNVAELIGARFLLGISSGTISASTALVAAETPPHRVGWALGVLTSGVALGRAFGPLAGGLLATFLPLRWAFIGGALFLLLATVPVVVMVKERPRAAVPPGASAKLRLTEPLLAQLGMRERFACVVSGDSVAERKPHPLPMQHAAHLAGVAPHACLYVGDAERDVQAAHAAGMPALVATYGYLQPDEDWQAWGAEGFVRQPLELLDWVERGGTAPAGRDELCGGPQ